jgi:enoyl-CoA hydratase/carnithine racemase
VAATLAAKLAAGPPVAMALMKRAINDSFSRPFDEVLEQESLHQSMIFSTKDLQEAISAFFEKRTPHFTGE